MNNSKKIALIILDGIGINKNTVGNAVFMAKKPNLDLLMNMYPHTELQASGEYVGLPVGQMGNSEVGHLNIGAGRIVYTGLSLINKEIKEKTFFTNKAFLNAIQHAKKNNSKIHILGLISNGGVHSSLEHIVSLIELVAKNNLIPILHSFSDGRDVDPKTFINDLEIILSILKKYNGKLATISGRYYAMDRDQRWDRIQLAYDAIIGRSKNTFTDPIKYVKESYINKINDEFILPSMNANFSNKEISIEDNDAIIFANFRPDRARQLSHVIFGSNYYNFIPSIKRENLYLVTMMNYEGIHPSLIAYPPIKLKNTLGKTISDNKLKQLRIAETEKYAHVTFFFDGGEEIDYQNESKILINSPKVATYDLKPEMSANEITEKLLPQMEKQDVIIVNYANGDMVGHTGNIQAAIEAVECVDKQIGAIYKKSLQTNTTLFITADHGNADEMLTSENKPITKHTTNPVPFIVTDKFVKLNSEGALANIAPTILEYLKINIPNEMTSKSLLKK